MPEPAVRETLKAPFQGQLDYFRGKGNLPTERWDDILGAAHDRAFIVAGAAKADLLNDLRQAVDKAIAQGTGLDAFRKDFAKIIQRTGWDYTGSFDWRTRVIYQTNIAASYAAGRWAQLNDPDLLKTRPFWKYVHSDAVANPRPLHVSWHGIMLPAGHSWFKTHFCPNGWGCHCRICAASQREYDAAPDDRKTAPDDGTYTKIDAFGVEHQVPKGIDFGFAHAPGANANTALREIIDAKLIRLDAPIGAAMMQALGPVLRAERLSAFNAWFDAVRAGPPRGASMVVGELKPQWVSAANRAGIQPATAEIAVRDADVWHTFRDSKADQLPVDWYKQLPAHLEQPAGVILDTVNPDKPAFLLIYPGQNDSLKLVVRVNYNVKRKGLMNIVETGKPVDVAGIQGMVGHGYDLVEGTL